MERHFCYSQHLTHPHPCYLGCTLSEVCVLTIIGLACNVVAATLLAFYWHHFLLNFLGFFLLLYPWVRFLATRLGKLKKERPPRYIFLWAYQWLNHHIKTSTPFMDRSGHWSTGRKL